MPRQIFSILSKKEVLDNECKRVIKSILSGIEEKTNFKELPEIERLKLRDLVLNQINSFYRLIRK